MSQVGEWKNQESECGLFESIGESVTEIGKKPRGLHAQATSLPPQPNLLGPDRLWGLCKHREQYFHIPWGGYYCCKELWQTGHFVPF